MKSQPFQHSSADIKKGRRHNRLNQPPEPTPEMLHHDDFSPIPLHQPNWMDQSMMTNDSGSTMMYVSYDPDPNAPAIVDPSTYNSNVARRLNVVDSSPDQSPTRILPSPEFNNKVKNLITASQITADDVLCGRGAGANTHPGNIVFRTLVAEHQESYLSSQPLQKTQIAKSIVAKITENGGRFLRRANIVGLDGKRSVWYDIGFKAGREKACQALRERSSSSSFDLPRKRRRGNTVTTVFDQGGDGGGYALHSASSSSEIEVNDRDVLMGRGGVTNSHDGNKIYRAKVSKRQREYLAAPKLKKAEIAMIVVDEIHESGGRFLLEKQGKWVEISREQARAKTSQALREKGPELRKIYNAAQELVAKKAAKNEKDHK